MDQALVFRPTRDFFSEAFGSQYCQGMAYTVRPGNDRLAKYVAQWADEELVTIDATSGETAGTQPATAGGAGTVG